MQKTLFVHMPYKNRFGAQIVPWVVVFRLLLKMVDELHGRNLNS